MSLKINKQKTIFLTLIFLFSLFLRIAASKIDPLRWWDETVYADLGWDLHINPFDYSFSHGWSDYVPGDWPKAGYRAPLLPYFLALTYLLKLNVDLLMPVIGALSVVFIYFLGCEMFNEKVAAYSSILMSILPIHVIYSGKILTGVFGTFFLIASIWFFWKGFEKRKDKYKILFGIFLAVSFLARYTVLFLFFLFPIYLFVKNKNLSFLKDKYLWFSFFAFLLVLAPWFIYGMLQYNNPLGPLLHAKKASAYWGGAQPWYYYFVNSFDAFSLLLPIFLLALIYIGFNPAKINKETIFLLIWFFIFLLFLQPIPHKEVRFLLPVAPSIVLLSSLLLVQIKNSKPLFLVVVAIVFIHLVSTLYIRVNENYNQKNLCLLKAFELLSKTSGNSVIITEQSPIAYFYDKRETHFYPGTEITSFQNLIKTYYKGRPIYIIWDVDKGNQLKSLFDSHYTKIYACPSNQPLVAVYFYRV